jgi:DNA-binding NarL/FixJ family response regulator
MDEGLAGRRILVVEDEYMLAQELALFLEQHGATVVGPAGTVQAALGLASREALDAAVLDVNLRNQPVYPAADTLIAHGVAIVFATGYDELLMQRPYIGMPRCSKPLDKEALLRVLVREIAARAGGR